MLNMNVQFTIRPNPFNEYDNIAGEMNVEKEIMEWNVWIVTYFFIL